MSKPTRLARPAPLEAFGQRHLESLETRLQEVVSGPGLLDRMARYHLATGGKRLRMLLPGWVCHNLGGEPEAAANFGVGLELIHNGTLVHDDVQDGDEWRRGQPSVWKRWGQPQAINVGDAMYFWGMAVVADGDESGWVAGHVARSVVATITGQVMEFQLRPGPSAQDASASETGAGDSPSSTPALDSSWDGDHLEPSLAAWVATANAKTGALFGACVAAGAIAAGRMEEADILAGQELGEALGLIFQVQDDFLDLVGDKGRERAGTDLAEGKLSYPVAWLYQNGAPEVVGRVRAIVDAPRTETSDAMVDEGLALLGEHGAIEATANWLRNMRESTSGMVMAEAVPGIVDRILAPVAPHL